MKRPLHRLKSYYQLVPHCGTQLFILIVLDVLSALLAMIPPLFAVLVFDRALPLRSLGWLIIAVGGGLASYLLYFVVSAVGDYWNARLDARITSALAVEGFQKIEESAIEEIHHLKVGDLTDRLIHAADVITGLLINLPSRLVISLIQIAVFVGVSFWLDRSVLWLGLASVPFYFLESRYFGERLRRSAELVRERSSDLYEGLQERLQNLKSIKTSSCEEKERFHIETLFLAWGRGQLRQTIVGLKQAFANSLILQIWTAAMTGLLGVQVIRGRLSVGEMVTLAIYLTLIQEPIRDLCSLWGQVKSGEASLRRFDELQSLPPELRVETETATEGSSFFKSDICFKEIHFSFKNYPVLQNFNARIPAQKLTALVGPSGIGKSTLAHLLLKLYQPLSGAIYFGEQDFSKISLKELRQHVGLLFQEPPLFSGTVRENIAYGHEGASLELVKEAARLAQADAFINQMPEQYESKLLWGGGNLSAGQKQRIALARTLLHKPDLLILDEPSSALDVEAEFHLGELLHTLKSKMTILLFSHSLPAVKQADRILFMDHGRVVEEGSFDELMARKGAFFDLHQIQMGGFQDFHRRLQIEMERHRRYKQAIGLLLFKLPPEAVETALRFIRRHLRVMDFAAQYLKDQIVIGLPEANTAAVEQARERLTKLLQEQGLSFQVGAVSAEAEEVTYAEALFNAAELKMGQPW